MLDEKIKALLHLRELRLITEQEFIVQIKRLFTEHERGK